MEFVIRGKLMISYRAESRLSAQVSREMTISGSRERLPSPKPCLLGREGEEGKHVDLRSHDVTQYRETRGLASASTNIQIHRGQIEHRNCMQVSSITLVAATVCHQCPCASPAQVTSQVALYMPRLASTPHASGHAEASSGAEVAGS